MTAIRELPVAATEASGRRRELIAFARELSSCRRCTLADTRTSVVFGSGDPDADLMFVGEAPGFHEDQQGKPFVGQAGKVLDGLLEEIGLTREQCFIGNVLKCRPPGNRDPQPAEIDACRDHLSRQIEMIEPRVICTLGNFATKLLSRRPEGITKVRGVPQERELAGRRLYLYPIFHPAAALYTPAMLERLRGDFLKIPELLERPLPALGEDLKPPPLAGGEPAMAGLGERAEPDQLDLF